jgi:hypothetical protein
MHQRRSSAVEDSAALEGKSGAVDLKAAYEKAIGHATSKARSTIFWLGMAGAS